MFRYGASAVSLTIQLGRDNLWSLDDVQSGFGCGGPIRTEYTIFDDTVPQRTDSFRRVSLRSDVSLDLRIVQPEIGRQLLR